MNRETVGGEGSAEKGRGHMKMKCVWSGLSMYVYWQGCSLTVDDDHCTLPLVQDLDHFGVTGDTTTGGEWLV